MAVMNYMVEKNTMFGFHPKHKLSFVFQGENSRDLGF